MRSVFSKSGYDLLSITDTTKPAGLQIDGGVPDTRTFEADGKTQFLSLHSQAIFKRMYDSEVVLMLVADIARLCSVSVSVRYGARK